MSSWLIVVTPLALLVILTAFGFIGCSSFSAGDPAPDPTTPGTGTPPTPPAPFDYRSVIAGTAGIAAHWPLDETTGNIASVLGSLAPVDNGLYTGGVTLGQQGALYAKNNSNFAPVLDGSTGFIEIPFDKRLNPGPTVPFSVELWLKPNTASAATTQVVISSHQIDPTNNRGYEIALVKVPGQAHHQVRGRLYSTAAPASEVTVQPVQGNADAWRLIVLTYQPGSGAAGKALTLYVGVAGLTNLFKSTPLTGADYQAVQSNKITMRFGAGHQQAAGAVDFFSGLIDEVAFYNVALPQADVETHYKTIA